MHMGTPSPPSWAGSPPGTNHLPMPPTLKKALLPFSLGHPRSNFPSPPVLNKQFGQSGRHGCANHETWVCFFMAHRSCLAPGEGLESRGEGSSYPPRTPHCLIMRRLGSPIELGILTPFLSRLSCLDRMTVAFRLPPARLPSFGAAAILRGTWTITAQWFSSEAAAAVKRHSLTVFLDTRRLPGTGTCADF